MSSEPLTVFFRRSVIAKVTCNRTLGSAKESSCTLCSRAASQRQFSASDSFFHVSSCLDSTESSCKHVHSSIIFHRAYSRSLKRRERSNTCPDLVRIMAYEL